MSPDIADQRPEPPRLRREPDDYADFFENAALGLHTVAADGTVLRINRAGLAMLGYAADECVNHPLHAFHVDHEAVDGILRRLKTGEDVCGEPVRLRCKDGSIRNALLDGNARREDGEFVYARCCMRVDADRPPLRPVHSAPTGHLEQDVADALRLHDISARLTVDDGLEAQYARLLDGAMEMMKSDMATMHMVDEAEGILRLLAWRGFDDRFARTFAIVRADAWTVCAIAWRRGQRTVIPDILDSEYNIDAGTLRELRRFAVRSVQCTPLLARDGRVLGMLSTHWRSVYSPTARDLHLLDVLARQAADLIGHRRSEHALQQQTERLQLLWEAAEVLLSADDPEAILQGLLAKLGTHLGVDAAFSYVLDATGEGLQLGSCIGIPAEAVQRWVDASGNPTVCGCNRPESRIEVITHIQQSDDPDVGLLKAHGIRACICNPLLSGDRLLGRLSFASRSKDRFDAEELSFLQTVCHYVTLAHERLRLLNRLRDADRSKDEFLATLAHELRNTLAPIHNAVQLLHRADTEDTQLRWSHEMIDRQVGHLSRLIDDLLDLSRIARNKLTFRRDAIEVSEVVADAVESARMFIEEHGHTLEVRLPPTPVVLQGDAVRLAQVLVNLLHNAAKYTEPGGRIWLTAERQGDTVELRVKDTGIGIPPDNLSRVFQIFFQSDRSLESAKSGLGIGLSLVRHLVSRHGGTVEAFSEGTGKGSEFVVRLPVAQLSGVAEPAPTAIDPAPADTGTRRILIADDNRDAADSLAMLLRLREKDVHTAYDGLEAVAAAAQIQPDAIVLDIGMPNLNGHDACRRIRAQDENRDTVIIALTGWDQQRDRLRTEAAGFDAHVVKPVDPVALLDLIATLRKDRPARAGAHGADLPR